MAPRDAQATAAGGSSWTEIAALGWMVYGVALVAPTASGSGFFGSWTESGIWAAFFASTAGFGSRTDAFQTMSGWTNLVMLTALATFIMRRGPRRRPSKVTGVILLCAAVINVGWLIEPVSDWRNDLLIGYYLWVASYATVGAAHLLGHARASDRN